MKAQNKHEKTSRCKQPFFCSWSGGKDSCLALYHVLQHGAKPQCLLTMMAEDGVKSRSHGLPQALIEDQARSLGIPVVFRSTSWDNYETVFISALHEFRKEGIAAGVFGDIDVESHRAWVQRVCALADIVPIHPLWKQSRRKLLAEFITLGFKAVIVVLKDDKLDKKFLGKTIDNKTIAELEKAGVDASGELGEYHTVVTAGPIFSSALSLKTKGQVQHEGYWFLDVEPCAGRQ
ncbi:MAG: diphthine--ammonia ligase [Kiritimatiellia bacterium]|nr:diphthine--ammonia ligase [Kiritimatiellia bacterium]